MRKSKYVSPYDSKGNTSFSERTQRSGVYVIRFQGQIIYVGMSKTNVYKTLYRHFQVWNDFREESRETKNQHARRYNRITYQEARRNNFKGYTIRVILATEKQTIELEKMLIRKHKPIDNAEKYAKYAPTSYSQEVIDIFGSITEEPPF
ncbi:hypothetical protein VB776_16400 [Arcicella sp. DC2W]|uniref:GIY-YIG domain-containing protein n=1 Tax=Arcicella gelida TaxID=2984195 RepID=A0ABU5S7P6_9BACT|nr:hypothetical protein [Arcicella sp. DC2W]MEA5404515.1 hypothetical protein [Arcicella sp. DC2W]